MKKFYGIFACDEGAIDWEEFETESEAKAYAKGIDRALKEADAGEGLLPSDFYRAVVSDKEPEV